MIEFKKQESQYEKTEAPRITGQEGETREYVAEVVKIEPFKSQAHPDWAPSIKLIFRILEEPFVGAFASGLVTSVWTPGNKLDRWLTALGVSGSNIGDKLSSDQLKKAVVRATIRIKDGFANVSDLGAMSEKDLKRISPDAHKKSAPQSQTPTQPPAQAPVQPTGQRIATTPSAGSVQITGTQPAPQPAPQQGQVTQDDSIPF